MARELQRLEVPCAADSRADHPTHVAAVYALVDGALCVHRGMGDYCALWVLTHIPTLRRLPLSFETETEAIHALDVLLPAGNWDVADYEAIRADAGLKAAVYALVPAGAVKP